MQLLKAFMWLFAASESKSWTTNKTVRLQVQVSQFLNTHCTDVFDSRETNE